MTTVRARTNSVDSCIDFAPLVPAAEAGCGSLSSLAYGWPACGRPVVAGLGVHHGAPAAERLAQGRRRSRLCAFVPSATGQCRTEGGSVSAPRLDRPATKQMARAAARPAGLQLFGFGFVARSLRPLQVCASLASRPRANIPSGGECGGRSLTAPQVARLRRVQAVSTTCWWIFLSKGCGRGAGEESKEEDSGYFMMLRSRSHWSEARLVRSPPIEFRVINRFQFLNTRQNAYEETDCLSCYRSSPLASGGDSPNDALSAGAVPTPRRHRYCRRPRLAPSSTSAPGLCGHNHIVQINVGTTGIGRYVSSSAKPEVVIEDSTDRWSIECWPRSRRPRSTYMLGARGASRAASPQRSRSGFDGSIASTPDSRGLSVEGFD